MKLEVLEQYLKGFTTAAKYKAGGNTVYLDLFAGGLANVNKETGEAFPGSSELALLTDPPFRTLRLFEMGVKAARLQDDLLPRFPERDVEVISGDCNDTLPGALARLNPHAPTFAFVDPDGLEVRWSTLEMLADHKRQGRSKYKVELWLLFATPGLLRTLALDYSKVTTAHEQRADGLFGSACWRPIYEARTADLVDGRRARQEYVNLMRWRLQHTLGYRYTHALEMKLPTGQPLYNMVFATDNKAGHDIMTSLYTEASIRYPKMQAERATARRLAERGPNLWEAAGVEDPTAADHSGDPKYVHDEPWEPPRRPEDFR